MRLDFPAWTVCSTIHPVSRSWKSEFGGLLRLDGFHNSLRSMVLLLPCLPPASTLQVDADGDGERPPGRSCVHEHTRSYLPLGHLPLLSVCVRLTSSSPSLKVKVCQQLIILCLRWSTATERTRFQFIHREASRCLPRLKGECYNSFRPPVCFYRNPHRYSKPGRMLMASQWALEAPPHEAVCPGKAEWIPSCCLLLCTEWSSTCSKTINRLYTH